MPGESKIRPAARVRRRWVVILTLAVLAWTLVLWRVLDPPPTLALERWSLRDMVRVEAGVLEAEGAAIAEEVSSFWIDRTEVTRGEWARFLAANPDEVPPDDWGGAREPREDQSGLPVVWVSLAQARRYAAWAGKRLPTAIEWDWAARARRPYPWGAVQPGGLVANLLELGHGRATPVGLFEAGRSPCGAYDMLGNVREWTATQMPGLNQTHQVVLGGSFRSSRRDASFAVWLEAAHLGVSGATDPGPSTLVGARNGRADDLGLRCVRDASAVRREIETADRVLALVPRLAARDPIGQIFDAMPARARIRDLGLGALAGLRHARAQVPPTEVRLLRAIDDLIATIRKDAGR